MGEISRRDFLKYVGAGAAYLSLPKPDWRIGDHGTSYEIKNVGISVLDIYPLAPTLLQLRKAYKTIPQIKDSIHNDPWPLWEYTSDFVNYNVRKPKGKILPKGFIYAELIQRPDAVTKEKDEWVAYGGKRMFVELPPFGLPIPDHGILYNPETGFPILTSVSLLIPFSKREEKRRDRLFLDIMPPEEAEVHKVTGFFPGEKGDGLCFTERGYSGSYGRWNIGNRPLEVASSGLEDNGARIVYN